MSNLDAALAKIAEQLGQSAPALWRELVRAEVVGGWTSCAGGVITMAVAAACAHIAARRWGKDEFDDNCFSIILYVVSGVLAMGGLIVVLSGIGQILAPEAHAIYRLLR